MNAPFIITAILTGWFIATSAAAQEIDPNEVRIISPTEATSTCIGDPKTPICAVETMMACVVRRDEELCGRVGVYNPCFDAKITGVRYRVEEVRALDEGRLPEYILNMRRGQERIAEVIYDYAYCGYRRCDLLTDGAALTLIEISARWRFADIPLDADQCSPDPD